MTCQVYLSEKAQHDLDGFSAKINMTAVTGLAAGQGRFGAILWVSPRDVKKAAKVFGVGLS